MNRRAYKADWQRTQRRKFAAAHGFSTAANYATYGIRSAVLERDGHKCVHCGMTADQHMAKWSRPITVDHKDKNRANNTMHNLQTLCLSCHGRKDQSPLLRIPIAPVYKPAILSMRKEGKTYEYIADFLELSIGTVHKWSKRWEKEAAQ